MGSLAERTTALRESIERLSIDIRDNVGTLIGEAQGGADKLAETAAAVRPEIGWLRDATVETSERLAATGDASVAAIEAVRAAGGRSVVVTAKYAPNAELARISARLGIRPAGA